MQHESTLFGPLHQAGDGPGAKPGAHPGPRRRTVLGGIGAGGIGAGALAAGLLPALPARAATAEPEDFAAARETWRTIITGGEADANDPHIAEAIGRLDEEAKAARAQLDSADDRVFTDLPLGEDAADMWHTYERLFTMATAYRTPGSSLHQDAAVAQEVTTGLRLAHDVVYHPGQEETGNWWHWEIGASRACMDTCLLVHDQLSEQDIADYTATIDYFVPDPFYQFLDPQRRSLSTGANRVDLCRAVLVRGLVGADSAKVTRARDGLSGVFAYVTSGDGIYRDGSFIQHTYVPYTGSYGQVLLDGLSRLMALLAGTPWPIVDEKVQIIFDFIDRGVVPMITDVRMMDSVRGRSVSRADQPDHYYGRYMVDAVLRIADAVQQEDPEAAARWRGHCKGWLQRTTAVDIYHGADVPRCTAYSALLDDSAVDPLPESAGLALFGSMARAVHRSHDWAYSIAMSSHRIAYYECGDGENEQGFHTGAGMTYLYDTDGTQFSDAFWPTVDLYRLPGITVDSKPLPDAAGGEWGSARPDSAAWAGGASLGRYGIVGMHLQGLQSSLEARKTWVCLDGVVLALGAGISGGGEHPVETVVENRNLHADGAPRLLLDGHLSVPDLESSTSARVRWAHLEGVGGYVFPERPTVQVLREERIGSWRDINDGGPAEEITRRYLTMWFDHGVQPQDASYAYLLAPGADPAQTRRLAGRSRGRLRILENSAQVQAVRDLGSRILAANFWGSGSTAQQSVPATADTYVNDGEHAEETFGDRSLILVKNVLSPDSGYSRQGFCTFELDGVSLPPEEIDSVTLRLWARVNDAGGTQADLVVHTIDEVVEEDSLTWNTKPVLGPALGTLHVQDTFAWCDLEVTGVVLERLRAGQPFSVGIVEPDGGTNGLSVEISSSEHPDNGPRLQVAARTEVVSVAHVSAETPCAVVLQGHPADQLEVAISDPTQEQDEVRVRIRMPRLSDWQAPETVTVTQEGNEVLLTARTEGTAGATQRVTLTP